MCRPHLGRGHAGVDDGRMRRNYTRAERDELIRAVTKRGESVRTAATRLGVTKTTAYHWLRAAAASGSEPEHARVRAPEGTFARRGPAQTQEAPLGGRGGEGGSA